MREEQSREAGPPANPTVAKQNVTGITALAENDDESIGARVAEQLEGGQEEQQQQQQ